MCVSYKNIAIIKNCEKETFIFSSVSFILLSFVLLSSGTSHAFQPSSTSFTPEMNKTMNDIYTQINEFNRNKQNLILTEYISS